VALSEKPPLFGRLISRIEPLLPIGGEMDGIDLLPYLKMLALAGYAVCSLSTSPVP